DILLSVICNSNISNLFFFIMFNNFLRKSIFLIIPVLITEILDISFFTILFIVFSSFIYDMIVPALLLNVDFVIIGILYFSDISTHLPCNTFAPSLDISIISLYESAGIFFASSILLGSTVYTPSTSENI